MYDFEEEGGNFWIARKVLYLDLGGSYGSAGKEPACNAGDTGDVGSIPGLGKIPWRRIWQPSPVFLPGKIMPWTEKPGGLQFMGSQRVGHD